MRTFILRFRQLLHAIAARRVGRRLCIMKTSRCLVWEIIISVEREEQRQREVIYLKVWVLSSQAIFHLDLVPSLNTANHWVRDDPERVASGLLYIFSRTSGNDKCYHCHKA